MKRGFTLIELLIVVAIIAILAAIAVPNFLEAQVRAKVSRAKSDMRSVGVALEAYATEWNMYPIARVKYSPPRTGAWKWPLTQRLVPLTTPVAYMSSLPHDPFPPNQHGANAPNPSLPQTEDDTFDYIDERSANIGPNTYFGRKWRLASAGPDRIQTFGTGSWQELRIYDPTNGTVSEGDIILLEGGGVGW